MNRLADTGCELLLDSETAMLACGQRLSACLHPGLVCHLQGPLGVGKTTLVRGLMRGLGYEGIVRSPTYALVESYELVDFTLYHLDLYRLADAEELEYMGMRDFLAQGAVCMIEWPECGEGFLPAADLLLTIAYHAGGRQLQLSGVSAVGEQVRQQFMSAEV